MFVSSIFQKMTHMIMLEPNKYLANITSHKLFLKLNPEAVLRFQYLSYEQNFAESLVHVLKEKPILTQYRVC